MLLTSHSYVRMRSSDEIGPNATSLNCPQGLLDLYPVRSKFYSCPSSHPCTASSASSSYSSIEKQMVTLSNATGTWKNNWNLLSIANSHDLMVTLAIFRWSFSCLRKTLWKGANSHIFAYSKWAVSVLLGPRQRSPQAAGGKEAFLLSQDHNRIPALGLKGR